MRDRILERRAKFVALALAGCQPSVAPVNAIDLPVSDASFAAQSIDASPIALEDDAGKPGSDIPKNISEETRTRYERVQANAARVRTELATLDKEIQRATPPSTPTGKATWMEIVARTEALYRSIGYMGVFCPTKRPETDAFLTWVGAENERLRTATQALQAKAEIKLADATMTGNGRWALLSQEYSKTHPMPCLSISCDKW